MTEEREHIVDGKPCWCGPRAQREGEAIIWVHRELPPCPECARLREELAAAKKEADKLRDHINERAAPSSDSVEELKRKNFEMYKHADAGWKEADALRAKLAAMEKVVEAAKRCDECCAEGGPEALGHGHVELAKALRDYALATPSPRPTEGKPCGLSRCCGSIRTPAGLCQVCGYSFEPCAESHGHPPGMKGAAPEPKAEEKPHICDNGVCRECGATGIFLDEPGEKKGEGA